MEWLKSLINFTDYNQTQQFFFFADAIFWIVTYILIERNVRRYKYVGIPYITVIDNAAWEFVWSFFLVTQLGEFFVWGIRIWFFIDLFIVYRCFQYGRKQVTNPVIKKHFTAIFIFGVVAWSFLFYAFAKTFNDPIGAGTGYSINFFMSIMYIYFFLCQPEQKAYSLDVAIFKMFGTGFVGVGVYFGNTPNRYVITIAIITLIIDLIYCGLIVKRDKIIQLKNQSTAQ